MVRGLVEVVLLPLFLAVLLLDLLIVPPEAIIAEALLGVSALGAVLGATLFAIVELLYVHTADLAEGHTRSHQEANPRRL
jgi:hypothetical protein